MTLFVRVYANAKKARDAAKKLKAEGLSDGQALILAPNAGLDVGAEVAAAVKGGRLSKAHAAIASQSLQEGRTVLSVDAPYGGGFLVTEIMDSFEPVAIDAAAAHNSMPRRFSEMFNMPTIWNGKSVFANVFGGELISSNCFIFPSVFGLGLLSNEPTPLSKRLGMRVLLERKKDWNLSFGQPILKATPKDWKQSFGQPLLSDDPTPLSSRLGMRVLSDKKFTTGEPVLSSDPAPLSNAVGMPLLSKDKD